jgi:hypothetical protein
MKFNKADTQQKTFDLKAASGVEVTPDILAKINKYALRELTVEEIFVRKYLMAHNAVDRDNERFAEALLDDFARTMPGKSLLNGHDRYTLPLGLFFDAATEEMTPEQFTTITGEEARLPEGIQTVKVLYGWIYMLKSDFNTPMTANIDAGIYRHASIGFRASDLKPVKGQFDNILFWEYVPPGEALEGSIVWLGAQPGATAQKKHGGAEGPASHKQPHNEDIDQVDPPDKPEDDIKTQGGTKKMKTLIEKLKMLFPKRQFSEENVADEIKTLIDEKDADITAKEARIVELSPLAADGKAYRDGLVTQYVAQKAKLGEVAETPEAQEKVKAVAAAYPIDFLKSEVEALEKRVAEKFPDKPQTKGDKRQDKSGDGESADWKKKNPIVPDDETKKEDK